MPSEKIPKRSISFRLSAAFVDQLRNFIRDYQGKPLYLEAGSFVEQALIRHIAFTKQRLAAMGDHDEPGQSHRKSRLRNSQPDPRR